MIDPHEWDMLMGSSALRDWNILPLSCKPSALTTRPWLLASKDTGILRNTNGNIVRITKLDLSCIPGSD